VEIRRRITNGESKRALAEEFQVGWGAVDDVVKRNTWKHI
jgi:hypothetical protein